MISFAQLAKDAHTTAVEKGWYDLIDGKVVPRDVGEVHSMFHSEISEAVEEFRAPHVASVKGIYFKDAETNTVIPDDPGTYISSPPCLSTGGADGCKTSVCKPEGAAVEMADLLIRLGDSAQAWDAADLVDRYASGYTTAYMGHGSTPVGHLASLHKLISDLFVRVELRTAIQKEVRDVTIIDAIASVVSWIYIFCKKHNLDLERAVMLKMAYNKTRSWRHGGKKA